MTYLIYPTFESANARAIAEGQAQNLPAWRDPQTGKTDLLSEPRPCVGGWALEVTGYQLTEAEQAKVATEVEWPEEM